MILVKTICRKIFDEVETEKDIKEKLGKIFCDNDYNKLIQPFWAQGKILKRKRTWRQDEVDNWIYESIIMYESIEAHNEILDASQHVISDLQKAGFEIKIKVKSISEAMALKIYK